MDIKSSDNNELNNQTKSGYVKLILLVVTILFAIITVLAVLQNGILAIFEYQFKNYGGVQVWVDLFIALSLFLVWMWFDAKEKNRNPWPWILITLFAGSFGPLLYLLFSKSNKNE